jgi:hypothetical protein
MKKMGTLCVEGTLFRSFVIYLNPRDFPLFVALGLRVIIDLIWVQHAEK